MEKEILGRMRQIIGWEVSRHFYTGSTSTVFSAKPQNRDLFIRFFFFWGGGDGAPHPHTHIY